MPGGDNTTEFEVEGASAASFSAPVAGYFGRIENFDPKVVDIRGAFGDVLCGEQCSQREKGSQFTYLDWWEDVCFVKEFNYAD